MSKTVRVQITSPVPSVKARIDEIHAVIDRHSFIEPMIAGYSRRALFADPILNVKKTASALAQRIISKKENEIPVLPVTSVPSRSCCHKREVPSSLLRADARIAKTIEEQARDRLERRKHFHRSCVHEDSQRKGKVGILARRNFESPVLKKESVNGSSFARSSTPWREVSLVERIQSPEHVVPNRLVSDTRGNKDSLEDKPVQQTNIPVPVSQNEKSKMISLPQTNPDTVVRNDYEEVMIEKNYTIPNPLSPKSVLPKPPSFKAHSIPNLTLEELIAETQQLLDIEGGTVNDQSWADEDIVAEIERDIENLSRDIFV
jgi:hypothetical protein